MKKLLLASALAALLVPLAAQAESTVTNSLTAAAPAPASARLDFRITIPKVLFLQVGTGAAAPLAALGTINKIEFDVPAGNVGNGTAVAPTTGGDLLGGTGVTVRVYSNTGSRVDLTSTTTGPMTAGGAASVPWSDIAVTTASLATPTAGYSNIAIPHPAFTTGASGGTSAAVALTGAGGGSPAGLVRREGSWVFAYANTAALPAGVYGDTAANNGRVTYTATAVP
ncbi:MULTISPECIES: hypothetical protein [unclassified Variovorax]|uniref:hypothetical protein n=1 Tax=unclassified Variovorax TaxID=663243 RepID=UPI001BD442B1|nr:MULTISPECIES: hypothetical protein [unclassified Variovorax]